MNILEQVYLWTYLSFLLCINIGVELLGQKVGAYLNLLEAAKLFQSDFYHLILLPTIYECLNCSTSCATWYYYAF